MHKIYTVILLIALVAQNEGASQGKWSRPIRNTQSDLTRQRRQFPYGEWIPLTKPCPTCRPLVDPLDVGQRPDPAGLVPPRPPTVTRQIHGEGNFFGQDDSAVLTVPPPPPSLPRHPGSNFQNLPFQGLPSFSPPLSISSQQIFPQSQAVQFLHQPFLPNQNLLVSPNQQILPVLPASSSSSVFGSETHGGQFVRNEKLPNFDSNFGQQKFTENVILEQNVRGLGGGSSSVFSSKPTPFPKQQNFLPQNSQQAFSQQQTILQQNSPQTFSQHQQTVIHQQHPRPQVSQQHNTIKLDDSILTPPPQSVANSTAQNLVLPSLEKEEIQLLYVPVETLRQRGNLQQQYLLQQQQQQQQQQHTHQIRLQQHHPQPQNVQLKNGLNSGRPSSTLRPTDPTPTAVSQASGHFVTENSPQGGQTLSSIKLSSSHPFSTASTPTTVFFQSLRSQPTPHPFVSATPITSTEPTFITPSPFSQKLVPVTPETTLPHLSTLQNTIPFSTPDIPFVTTPKTILSEGSLSEEIITGKPQFEGPQKLSQPFAYQSFQQGNVHLQSFGQTFPETRPTSSSQYFHQQNREKQTSIHSKDVENQQNIKSQKTADSARYPQQQQVQENELREQYLQTQRFTQQQQRQNDLEEQRILQKQRKQKEFEEQKKREHEQRRQKEIEQEMILQQQRQSELEEQRRLQQQRQNELEEQRRLERLRDAEEKRLSQQKQRQQDSRERQRWQQQQQYQQQQTNFDQSSQYQLLDKQKNEDDKQQYYQQRQQQQILQHVHQVQQQQQQQQDNKNVFSEADNANFISQAEQESETENPQLVPHQPPLSVFFKGYGKTGPRISEVLRELRNSRAITVLDQYFEKMPKVFVGPAGLVPPNGYDKYDLPYLSNIENRLNDNEKDKLPFFVAPLNFVPPIGYSKIPFPSPHVGSVVISSDSLPAATAKPREAESSSSEEEDERTGSFPLVGPELPGLINGLETEKNIVRTTTPSLPQTTAQLRNRRPNNNLYRQRKPVSRTRSTTTTTSTNRPEITEQKSDESDSGLRKPFNRFLKRRRQPVKSTTEYTIPEYQTDKKPVQNRYYSSQSRKQSSEGATSGGRKYGNQGLERTTSVSQTDFETSPTPSTYKLAQVTKDRPKTLTEESDNSLQSEEEGPYPTGSAKTITQQIYRSNDLKQKEGNSYTDELTSSAKLEPKVDTSTVNAFDAAQTTKFYQQSDVNPTVGYVKSSEEKSVESGGYATLQVGDRQYAPFPTSLKYFDPTESPLPLVSVQAFQPSQQPHIQPTTEFITLDDRYTAAFAEISKHHHIPGPHQTKPSENRPTLGLSIELQAPFSDSYSQEQQSQSYSSEELSKSPRPGQYSGEYSSSSGSSSSEYSGSVQDSKTNGNEFYPNPTVSGPYSSRYTENYIATTTNSFKLSPDLATTEPTNYGNEHQTTAGVATLNAQTFDYNPPSGEYSSEEYRTIADKTQNQQGPKGTDNIFPTTLPTIPTEPTEFSAKLPSQTTHQNLNDQRPTVVDSTSTKLSNPSAVRVKTRVRGKQRGQVSYPQSTASASFPPRSRQETKSTENGGEEHTGNSDYQQTTSKYNFRGLKKPFRPTIETTTEKDLRSHIFTVKPLRRPTNPSTVSTKRVRRPTTPLPTEESSHETNTYTPELEYPTSGVSNDVYYEQTNQSPGRLRYKKPYNSRQQETEPASTLKPTAQTYYEDSSSSRGEEYSTEEESRASESASHELPHTKHQWSSTESDVLSSTSESAEVKKGQDSKKAFDPDLEKKNGRRRVRVRVNKRPHENFETAESQNLRTVANVLVPVTPAYKPGDDANLQLAKNSDANHESDQKSYGYRSREYFRKRFNLTLSDVNLGQQSDFQPLSTGEQSGKGAGEEALLVSGGEVDGGKPFRGKFRGYVRKVIKHPVGRKEGEQKSEQTVEHNEEPSQQDRLQQGGFNQTARFPGTRHKTFVRYVKKNKVKFQEPEHQEKEESPSELTVNQETQQQQDEKQQRNTQSDETTASLQSNETDTEQKSDFTTVDYPETQPTEEPEVQTTTTTTPTTTPSYVTESGESQESTESRQTKESEEQSTQPIDFIEITDPTSAPPSQQTVAGGQWQQPGRGATKLYPVASQSSKTTEETYSSVRTTEVYPLKSTEGRVGYKNKYFQTLRPVYSRAPNTGILRLRDPLPPSTTEQSAEKETTEKKIRLNKYKYGKITSFGSGNGSSTSQSTDGKKETAEQQTAHDNKNKNAYTYDVRKYTRGGTKTREGGFKQFNRNRYTPFGKTQTSSSSSRDETNDPQDDNQETTHDDHESTTPYASTVEVESTTEQLKITSSEEDVTTSQPTADSGETASTSSSSSSSEEENDEFFTTEKTETTLDDKFDISTLIYGNSEPGMDHLTSTEVFTSTDPASKESKTTTVNDANTQPDLYRFAKNSFSFDETEKFTGTKNRAYVRNITADILGLSAPGTDQGNEIIVSPTGRKATAPFATTTETSETEVATSYEKTDEPVTDHVTEAETTDSVPTTVETVSVNANAIHAKTADKKVIVTVSGGSVSDEETLNSKVSKLLKTSTQTKVSHETEICYRGKCIRTKSENPDEDLKLLVDSTSAS